MEEYYLVRVVDCGQINLFRRDSGNCKVYKNGDEVVCRKSGGDCDGMYDYYPIPLESAGKYFCNSEDYLEVEEIMELELNEVLKRTEF